MCFFPCMKNIQQILFCFFAHSHTVYILVVQQAHRFSAIRGDGKIISFGNAIELLSRLPGTRMNF